MVAAGAMRHLLNPPLRSGAAHGDTPQTYWWVNGVDFSGHSGNVLECQEQVPGKEPRRFVFLKAIVMPL